MPRFSKLRRVCLILNHHPRIDRRELLGLHTLLAETKPNQCVIEFDIRYLAPLRALLPSHWEYHFLQGPLECGPAPGIGEIYPNQTYNCWFHIPSLIEFQSVHDFLEEMIEEEGPFDVAWGFSAVRLTNTLHRNINLSHSV